MSSAIKYYVVDVETNGLSAVKHEITQISLIRNSDRHQISKFIKIEHPENTSIDALNATNRTYADLLKGAPKAEVVNQIDEFILQDGLTPESRCAVGYNLPFDMRFLTVLWSGLNKKFPFYLWLDILPMMRQYAKHQGLIKPKLTLGHSLAICKLKPRLPFHSAITDTQNTYILNEFLIKQAGVDHLPHIKRITGESE